MLGGGARAAHVSVHKKKRQRAASRERAPHPMSALFRSPRSPLSHCLYGERVCEEGIELYLAGQRRLFSRTQATSLKLAVNALSRLASTADGIGVLAAKALAVQERLLRKKSKCK